MPLSFNVKYTILKSYSSAKYEMKCIIALNLHKKPTNIYSTSKEGPFNANLSQRPELLMAPMYCGFII